MQKKFIARFNMTDVTKYIDKPNIDELIIIELLFQDVSSALTYSIKLNVIGFMKIV